MEDVKTEEKIEEPKIKDFKKEAFKRKVKSVIKNRIEEAKDAASNAVEWVEEHPKESALIVAGLTFLTKKGFKIKADADEKRNRERWFYDARLRTWVETRRKLTNSEMLEVEERYERGESYRRILTSMRLAK